MAEGTQGFNISNVIDEKLIALDLDVNTKEEMLNALTDLFEEQGKLNDREGFFKDVMWREGEGQTGIGMGVAIPHGKSAGVNETALASARRRTRLRGSRSTASRLRLSSCSPLPRAIPTLCILSCSSMWPCCSRMRASLRSCMRSRARRRCWRCSSQARTTTTTRGRAGRCGHSSAEVAALRMVPRIHCRQ